MYGVGIQGVTTLPLRPQKAAAAQYPPPERRLNATRILIGIWLLILIGLCLRLWRAPIDVGAYDLDIDTFLYLGDRLLQGGLLYVDGFDSKWPIVQYLFAPSAWLGSIRGHRILILLLNMASAALLARTITLLSRRDLLALMDRSLIPMGSAILYIAMSQKMIGGLSGHLHHYANAFLVLGLFLLARRRAVGDGGLVGAGACLALAVAVRPNLILPMALAALTLACTLRPWPRWRRLQDIAAVTVGGLLATGLIFLPYFFVADGLRKAWAGAIVLLLEWNTQWAEADFSFSDIAGRLAGTTIAGVEAWMLLAIPLFGVMAMAQRTLGAADHAGGRRLLLPGLCVVYLGGLVWSFKHTHFWGHYELMAAVPMVLFIAAGMATLEDSSRRAARAMVAAYTVIVSLILFNNIFLVEALAPAPEPGPDTSQHLLIQADRTRLIRYLQWVPEAKRSFTSPQDFSLHWRFHMPSSTAGVHPSWSLDPYGMRRSWATDLIGLPISEHEACAQLTDRRHQLLIWTRTERGGRHEVAFLRGCLEADTARWEEITRELGLLSGHHRVFRRRLE